MDPYISLAKQTIEQFVKNKRIIEVPKDLPEEFFSRKAGVFVTIRKASQLRGCIGTNLPSQKNIAEEIIHNTIAACSKNSRFLPVSKEELPELSYEVSILSKPKLIEDTNKLDPKKNGIIVKCLDGRCGLLLPDIDGIETVDQQIFIASQKGEINPLLDKIQLYYFTVEKHKL